MITIMFILIAIGMMQLVFRIFGWCFTASLSVLGFIGRGFLGAVLFVITAAALIYVVGSIGLFVVLPLALIGNLVMDRI